MLAGLIDHLWQSAIFCAATWGIAFVTRENFAELHLWLWRIAALKFVLPFALLFAAGEWLGFPVPHTADPTPAPLVEAIRTLTPIFSPARSAGWGGAASLPALVLVLLATAGCARWLRRKLHDEQQSVQGEAERQLRDVNDIVARPGFFKSAMLTACALLLITAPLLAGAVADRQERRELLIANSLSLRRATVVLTAAAPGMGTRYRVTADLNGVLIRNANVRELVALAYGLNSYYVRGDHFYEAGEQDWLLIPRYDVRVVGTVREPERFDTYALRQTVTKLLADRFGLEIYLNDACQPPCGKYGVAMRPEPL